MKMEKLTLRKVRKTDVVLIRRNGPETGQKRAGVKSFMRLTQNLKLYMRQQVSSFLGCFAEVRLRGLGAT